ncbi:MAG: glycosyltransferase [Lachnospiraceae bacterium]|nr:glycosyltransferase [Lachnospiraceae bacterium]MCM1238783.1 glycosyltransferase [Lachnospiraceae bacterium]
MEKPIVSVIVPVYNVMAYLKRCIDSIRKQTYGQLEILLVDDGSTDGSERVCDEYADLDRRIRVIHKQNGGLSDARNAGIEAATGQYIAFIDSDDFVSNLFVEVMLNALQDNQADMSMIKKEVPFWDGEQLEDSVPLLREMNEDIRISILNPHDALERMFYRDINTGAPFKFLKREILGDIRFPVGWLYEDVATTYKMLQSSRRIAVVEAPLYAYRKRADSIIRQKYDSRKLTMLSVMEQVEKDILSYDPTLKKAFYARKFSSMCTVFLQIPEREKESRELFWNRIKESRMMVLFDLSPYLRRKDRIGAMASLLGKDVLYRAGRRFGQKGTMYR